MPATVIAERIGWTRGLTVFKERVRELRPVFAPPDPASRTAYLPGELAQCDLWFPPADVPLGAGQVGRPPVLVMVAGYSRVIAARMVPTRTAEDLLAGMWALLAGWGAVPRTFVWDNEGAIGSWKSGRPTLTGPMQAFRGTLGITVRLCRPADPEAKGLVERANGYLETSFLPGRAFGSGEVSVWCTTRTACVIAVTRERDQQLGRPAGRGGRDRCTPRRGRHLGGGGGERSRAWRGMGDKGKIVEVGRRGE